MVIPPQAKKVFQGVQFAVWQWEQEMFDGSTETFEAIERGDSAMVIAIHEGEIIINHEEHPGRPPFLSLPGGFLEQGEDHLLGAQRELLEETGLVSDDWSLFRDFSHGSRINWHTHCFIARNCRKVAEQHLDVGEKVDVQAYTFEEFLAILRRDDFRNRDVSLAVLKMGPEDLAAFQRSLFTKQDL